MERIEKIGLIQKHTKFKKPVYAGFYVIIKNMKQSTAKKIIKLSEQSYENIANDFSNTRKFFWNEIEFIKKYTKTNDKVLDIGCGNGRLLELFKNKNINYTGIDSSKKLIRLAKEKYPNHSFFRENALDLPFADNSFNIVYSVAVLHHIPSKELQKKFVNEISKVLKKDGKAVIIVWYLWQPRFKKEFVKNFYNKFVKKMDLDIGDLFLTFGNKKEKRYLHAWTKWGLYWLFKKTNFKIISLKKVNRKSGYANLILIIKKK